MQYRVLTITLLCTGRTPEQTARAVADALEETMRDAFHNFAEELPENAELGARFESSKPGALETEVSK